jgi:hypothetical protein
VQEDCLNYRYITLLTLPTQETDSCNTDNFWVVSGPCLLTQRLAESWRTASDGLPRMREGRRLSSSKGQMWQGCLHNWKFYTVAVIYIQI